MNKPTMKNSSHHTKPLDSPKPVREMTAVNEKKDLLPAESLNLSEERLKDGASTTTEVLHEILQRKNRVERD